MKPYYEQDGITIYHGDCRELVARGDADIVTDPPYGISLANRDVDGHRRAGSYRITGDDNAAWIGNWLWETASDRVLIVFASPWRPWPGEWRNLIVWDKGGAVGGGGDIETCLKRSWELIQVANNDAIIGPRAESVWRFPVTPADSIAHVAAKPTALVSKLLHTFTTGAITDPFMGSGTTLVAAKNLGRKAIGIEIEERYCEIAARRLDQQVLAL